jgi:hypothetical protein
MQLVDLPDTGDELVTVGEEAVWKGLSELTVQHVYTPYNDG